MASDPGIIHSKMPAPQVVSFTYCRLRILASMILFIRVLSVIRDRLLNSLSWKILSLAKEHLSMRLSQSLAYNLRNYHRFLKTVNCYDITFSTCLHDPPERICRSELRIWMTDWMNDLEAVSNVHLCGVNLSWSYAL